jgi:hypothetical protein
MKRKPPCNLMPKHIIFWQQPEADLTIWKHPAPKHVPKTWTSKPTTHQNMSSFDGWFSKKIDAWIAQYPKHTTHQNM